MENKQQTKKESSMKSVNGSRGFLIRNFKNLGVYKENSIEEAFLRLSSLKNLGGLVCVLGENNTGKSNLLAALEKFGKIGESPALNEDKPDFLGYETCLPKIELSYRVPKQLNEIHCSDEDKLSGKTYSIVYSFEDWKRAREEEGQRLHKAQWQEELQKVQKFEREDFDSYIKNLQNTMNASRVSCYYNKNNGRINLTLRDERRIIVCESRGEHLECVKDHLVEKLYVNLSIPIGCQFVINGTQKVDNAMDIMELFIPNEEQRFRDDYEKVRAIMYLDENGQTQQACFSDVKIEHPDFKTLKIQPPHFPNLNLGIPLIPKIILYVENELHHKDLLVAPDEIHNSLLFQSLFKIIKEDMNLVRQAYKKSQETQNPGHRSRAEINVNEKLKYVNQMFNDLYNKDDEVYRFQIRLEDSKFSLEFYKNGETLTLDKQSVGFRKFFNFFFNFLYAGTVGQGDIVLIDEAETHLSPDAQGEFRKFLKEFGQEHGILFVITTHSPFMLDMNHLDEIRILKTKEDGLGVEIINEFSQVTDSDVDILKKIIEALGAKLYHLINPKSKPIFVEGVTDYHYLVALSACYNKEHDKSINLTFLPIGGLGEEEQQQIEKMKSLISFGKDLRILPAILLVDHDGAGRAIKKLEGEEEHKDSLKVIPLNECGTLKSKFPQYVEIEDLFSKADREKFGISKEEKNSQAAADFKNTKDLETQLDKETKDNFYALLKYLDSV